jgi:hypothetical protein
MTNRREFLQAAAISGLPVIAGSSGIAHAAQPNRPPRLDIHTVLVDGRHAEALSAGARLAGQGATVHATADGDITQIWLSRIGPAWREQPLAIAGLTARPALFCLEQLALSCGLRVVFHGEHLVYRDGRTEHSLLRGAEGAQLSVRELARARALWPARVADAIAIASYRQNAGLPRPGRSDAALEPMLPRDAQLLTSWIIAAV